LIHVSDGLRGSYRCTLRPEYTIGRCERDVGGRHTQRIVGSITRMTVTLQPSASLPLIRWLDVVRLVVHRSFVARELGCDRVVAGIARVSQGHEVPNVLRSSFN
jgi:hypothetical protein